MLLVSINMIEEKGIRNICFSLCEYAPTAMINLSYRIVKGVLYKASSFESSAAVGSATSPVMGRVAGI